MESRPGMIHNSANHPRAGALNAVSRFLAGLPEQDRQDVFSSQRERPAWQLHAATLDDLFAHFDRQYAQPVARWARSALAGKHGPRAVFYPFSGPDFTFAHLLFPAAETFILCGLESCEPLSVAAAFAKGGLSEPLEDVAANLSHFLRQSYFVTKDMRERMETGLVPGVAPVLLVLLARAGMTIDSVATFDLPEGEEAASCSPEATGLRIDFRSGTKRRRLFYFRQDLRDAFFSEESAVSRFVAEFGRVAVFVKSASYLLHELNFSNVRELIFERSSLLVQDPSCMPYGALAERGWTIDLHGRHTHAPASFRKYEQPDLVGAYGAFDRSAEPLGFGIGYHTDPGAAALMVATPRSSSSRGEAFRLVPRAIPESAGGIRPSGEEYRSDGERA